MLSRKTMSVLILLALVAVAVGIYAPLAPAGRQTDGSAPAAGRVAQPVDAAKVPRPGPQLPVTTLGSQAQRSVGQSNFQPQSSVLPPGSSFEPNIRVQRTLATRSPEAVPRATFLARKDAKDELQTTVYATGDMTALKMMEVLRPFAVAAQFTVGDDDKTLIVVAPPAEHEKICDAMRSLRKKPFDPIVSGNNAVLADSVTTALSRAWRSTEPGLARSQNRQELLLLSSLSSRRPAPADPEMAKLELADATAGKKVAEIVKAYRTASGEEQQAEARLKLKTVVDEHFAVRQEKRALEVSRLEARLEKIRQSIAKRDVAREQIVDRHISKLLGEADDLEF